MRDETLSRWKKPGVWLLGLLALGLGLSLKTRLDEPNLYALQADAWLQGRMDVAPGPHDLALHGGKAWVPFPPFPSVLLLPVVAVTGPERAPVRAVAVLLSLLAGGALWRLLTRLELPRPERSWLAAAFLLGTGFWSCVLWSGGVWFFAREPCAGSDVRAAPTVTPVRPYSGQPLDIMIDGPLDTCRPPRRANATGPAAT